MTNTGSDLDSILKDFFSMRNDVHLQKCISVKSPALFIPGNR